MQIDLNKTAREFIKDKFIERYPIKEFKKAYDEYRSLKEFKAHENVFENAEGISEQAHWIMRCTAEYYMRQVFHAMKFDMDDPNITDERGGTPYRMIKVMTGDNTNDMSELGSGRWTKPPRIASFEIDSAKDRQPVTKRFTVISNCSHHFLPFSTEFNDSSYAIISYVPNGKYLGISKLQRFADWILKRYHIQEQATKMIFEYIKKITGSDDVYVKMVNVVHTCEKIRGARSTDSGLTTMYFSGLYESAEMRIEVEQSA